MPPKWIYQHRVCMTRVQGNAKARPVFPSLALRQGWYPFGEKTTSGIFLAATRSESESPFSVRDHWLQNKELCITSKTWQQLNLETLAFMRPSHISWKCIEIPELYWKEIRINRSHASERVLGVAERADFENLATQDTLWVSFFKKGKTTKTKPKLTHQILLKGFFY